MNFKGFLKRTGFALLVEEWDKTDKDNWKKQAYRRLFKNNADPEVQKDADKAWNAVLNKSVYKVKPNSKPETRRLIGLAKGIVNQYKTLKQEKGDTTTDDETGTDDREIKDLASELDENDAKEIISQLQTDFPSLKDQITSLKTLKDTLEHQPNWSDIESKAKELINAKLSDDPEEVKWKDKTLDDIDSLDVNDFEKIKENLKKIEGFENVETLEDLKKITDKELPAEKIEELDKLLEKVTPAEPQETTTVNTQNTSIIDAGKEMEERILKQQKMERLKKAGVPLTPDGDPDFNQEITFQIMNQQKMNGDSTLWDEYIKTTGLEDSEYVKKFLENQKKQEETKKKAIEDQKQRFENEKSFATACSGVFALTAALAMFLTSKNSSENLEKWNEQRKRISVLKDSMSEFSENSMYVEKDGKKISREDIAKNDYNNEQQALLNDYNARKAELEKESQDPRSTDAFKIKSTAILQQFANRKQELLKQNQELQPKQQRSADIKKVTLALISQSEDEQIETLKNVVPRNEGEDDNAYNVRLKTNKDQLISDLNNQAEQIDNEIAENIKQIDNLGKEMDNALKELEESDEVQKEFKKNSKNYQIKLSSLEAQYTLNKNKSTQDYERRMRAIKEQQRDAKAFSDRIATLAVLSSKPDETINSELLTFYKRTRQRFQMSGIAFDENELPDSLEAVKKKMEEAKKKAQSGNTGTSGTSGLSGKAGKGTGLGGLGGLGGEPDPDPETPKKPVGKAKQQLDTLRNNFAGKKLAENRLNAFLKAKNIDPETAEDSDLQKALEEFKNQKFPNDITDDSLKSLGIEEVPDGLQKADGSKITTLTDYADYLKDPKNAKDLNKLKEDLGFEDTGKATPKTDPIKIPDSFNPNDDKLKGLKIKDENGQDVDLTDPQNWEKYKESPEVLKKYSEGELENETPEKEENVTDPQDGTDEAKHLKKFNIETLWKKLNEKGISIRALPGYDPNWDLEKKKDAIIQYILKNKNFFGYADDINESKILKTAFQRFNKVSKAQKRLSEKRSLKKFAELLVNDLRTFG